MLSIWNPQAVGLTLTYPLRSKCREKGEGLHKKACQKSAGGSETLCLLYSPSPTIPVAYREDPMKHTALLIGHLKRLNVLLRDAIFFAMLFL